MIEFVMLEDGEPVARTVASSNKTKTGYKFRSDFAYQGSEWLLLGTATNQTAEAKELRAVENAKALLKKKGVVTG